MPDLYATLIMEHPEMRRPFLAMAFMAIMTQASSALAQAPDPNFYYKLSTQFLGENMPMDVFDGGRRNNQARLNNDQNVSGQHWQFEPIGKDSYRLRTEFAGPGMCLEINSSTNRPELRDCGDFTGQFWQIRQSDEWMVLTTTFGGSNMCLDIDPDSNQPELRRCSDYSGQFWRLQWTGERVSWPPTR
jgi:hypothetical protein